MTRYNNLNAALLEIEQRLFLQTGKQVLIVPDAEYISIMHGNKCIVLDSVNCTVQIATGNPQSQTETGLEWEQYQTSNTQKYINFLNS